jgi:hypothetical protein
MIHNVALMFFVARSLESTDHAQEESPQFQIHSQIVPTISDSQPNFPK